MYRYPPMAPPPVAAQPASSNSNVKIVAIVMLFICVFGALLMAMLAGSNPLSHKTSKNSKNTDVDTSASASLSSDITAELKPALASCSIM
jgi:hypothetical protein